MVKYLEAVDMASIVYVYVPSFPGAFVWRFWDLINPLLSSELAARLTVDTEKPHSDTRVGLLDCDLIAKQISFCILVDKTIEYTGKLQV